MSRQPPEALGRPSKSMAAAAAIRPGTQKLVVGEAVRERELERLAVAGRLADCEAVRLREALMLGEGEALLE